MSGIIAAIATAIRAANTPETLRLLKMLPVAKLPLDDLYKLLIRLLTVAMESSNDTAGMLIIENAVVITDGNTRLVTLRSLFKSEASVELLKYVTSLYDTEVTFMMMGEMLIDDDGSPVVQNAFAKMLAVFPEQERSVYMQLYQYYLNQGDTDDAPNMAIGERLKALLEEDSNAAPIPGYIIIIDVKLVTPLPPLPFLDAGAPALSAAAGAPALSAAAGAPALSAAAGAPALSAAASVMVWDDVLLVDPSPYKGGDITLPSADVIALMIEQQLSDEGLTATRGTEEIKASYESASIEAKAMLTRALTQSQAAVDVAVDDLSAFRILGPVNPNITMDVLHDQSRCTKYGGCRMFTCIEHDNIDPDTGEPNEDLDFTGDASDCLEWFTGVCGTRDCNLSIEKPCYARRLAVPGGGWSGCYCSAEHALADYDGDERSLVEELNELVTEQLNRYKIYDRKYRGLPRGYIPLPPLEGKVIKGQSNLATYIPDLPTSVPAEVDNILVRGKSVVAYVKADAGIDQPIASAGSDILHI